MDDAAKPWHDKYFGKYKRKAKLFARACWHWGWRGAALAAVGAIGALGFQPLGLWPLALFSVVVLLWIAALMPHAGWAALVGWVWGLGHFTLGLNWIATAFTYQAKMPSWLGGLAVFLLSLYLALFPAMAMAGGWFLRGRFGMGWGASRVLGFAGCWILSEALRGFLFTGFPWNPLGAALLGGDTRPGLALLAPWLGTYGLSGLMVIMAGVVAEGRRLWFAGNRCGGGAMMAGPFALGLGAVVLPGPATPQGHVAYTLIQPNIAQEDLDDPNHFEAQYVASAKLSAPRQPGLKRLVLWPESGVPDYVRDGYPAWYYQFTFGGDPWLARWRLARTIGAGGLLLSGTVDLDLKGVNAIGGQNVIAGIDDHGRIVAHYAKAHLVPFGEYLPQRDWLKQIGLERLVPGDFDFRPGPGAATLDLGPLGKAGMQICYEIIFPGAVVDRAHRPDYIFNPSNDGWFGSWGPPQHLAQARLRAIEEGLPVLRSTTNGVSAVVDAHGVIRQKAVRGQAARLDGLVPPALAPTLFARWGNMLSIGIGLVLLMLAALVLRRTRG